MQNSDLKADLSPWINIDLHTWQALINDKNARLFQKDTFLFYQDSQSDVFYIIASGRVRVTSFQADGGEKQLYIAERGSLCGESPCMQRYNHSSSAVAIVDVTAYSVTRDQALKIMQNDWELTQNFISFLCRKCTLLSGQILELSFSSAEERVARILIELCEQYGSKISSGTLISIKFTHQDVANIVNASRVTVSNIMNKMIMTNIISKKNGHYIIKDIQSLQSMASIADKPAD